MKNITLTLCLLAATILAANAQDIKKEEVPAAVQKSFKMQYAQASDIEWKKDGTNYMASFKTGTAEHNACLSPTGKLISFGEIVPNKLLPDAVTLAIRKAYPKAEIDDVEKIVTGKAISYKVGLDGTTDATLWYSAAGKLLKKNND